MKEGFGFWPECSRGMKTPTESPCPIERPFVSSGYYFAEGIAEKKAA
jgi:hypothetical protein